jgi:hypothetical protein
MGLTGGADGKFGNLADVQRGGSDAVELGRTTVVGDVSRSCRRFYLLQCGLELVVRYCGEPLPTPGLSLIHLRQQRAAAPGLRLAERLHAGAHSSHIMKPGTPDSMSATTRPSWSVRRSERARHWKFAIGNDQRDGEGARENCLRPLLDRQGY